MTYTITFDLDGAEFSVSAEDVEGLAAVYSSFGGSRKVLKDRAEAAIKAFQNGLGLGPAAPAEPASASEADAGDAWDQAGPWKGSGSPPKQERTDPWDDEPVPASKPAQRRSAPSRGTSAPVRQDPAETFTQSDQYGREWTVGLPDAPDCDCDPPKPTARMKAKAGPNAKNPGKPYIKFRCAKAAPGGDWRNKCDYDEFPPR